MWFPRQGHKEHNFHPTLSLRSRGSQIPCHKNSQAVLGQFYRKRMRVPASITTNLPAMWVRFLGTRSDSPFKPSVDCMPDQHFDYIPMSDPETEFLSQPASYSWLHETVRAIIVYCCFQPPTTVIIYYVAIDHQYIIIAWNGSARGEKTGGWGVLCAVWAMLIWGNPNEQVEKNFDILSSDTWRLARDQTSIPWGTYLFRSTISRLSSISFLF